MEVLTHQQFVDKATGKWIVRTTINGFYVPFFKDTKDGDAQCLTLSNQYVCETFGYPTFLPSPIAAATAYLSFVKGHPDFIKIESDDVTLFRRGDVIFWLPKINAESGGQGHTGIFDQLIGDGGFISFEQNNPVGSNCHMQRHSSNRYVAGVLRHKSLVEKPVDNVDNFNKASMQLFKQAQQLIYTKANEVTEFWIIWLTEDNIEKKRKVTAHKNRCQDIFSGAGKYFRWSTPEQLEILSRLPQGEDFDIEELNQPMPGG